MMGNCQVRFGGGPMEKCPNGQLASGLPNQFRSTYLAEISGFAMLRPLTSVERIPEFAPFRSPKTAI
jgi:hypothetical protein